MCFYAPQYVYIAAFSEAAVEKFVHYVAPLSALVAGVWLISEIATATTRSRTSAPHLHVNYNMLRYFCTCMRANYMMHT